MKTIISQSWKFNTYKIQGKCKCSECGRSIVKTFSFELREDVSPAKEDWQYIEQKKQAWLKETHICNRCMQQKIKSESKDITKDFAQSFDLLESQQNVIRAVRQKKQEIIESLRKQLIDKVLIESNTEWVIISVNDGWQNDTGLELTCYKVNKQKPWRTVDETKYFYYGNIDGHYHNYIPLNNCIITDENFNKRKELL